MTRAIEQTTDTEAVELLKIFSTNLIWNAENKRKLITFVLYSQLSIFSVCATHHQYLVPYT